MTDSMPSQSTTEEALALAHVRRVKRFYVHLVEFMLIMGGMLALNLAFTPQYLWSLWLLTFWVAGIAIYALQTFDRLPFFSAEWERRQVERRLGRSL